MTAKEYHEKIIVNNPQAEAWGLDVAFEAGYTEGYSDGLAVKKVLSDETIIKIINLYNKFGADKVDENFNIVSIETIKEYLYDS